VGVFAVLGLANSMFRSTLVGLRRRVTRSLTLHTMSARSESFEDGLHQQELDDLAFQIAGQIGQEEPKLLSSDTLATSVLVLSADGVKFVKAGRLHGSGEQILLDMLVDPSKLREVNRRLGSLPRIDKAGLQPVRRLYWLVRDYVPGVDLESAIVDCVSIDVAPRSVAIARVFRDLGQSVAELHRLGYVHTDINPKNVVLSRPDQQQDVAPRLLNGTATLIDFELSRHRQDTFNPQSRRAHSGTPGFVAPEVVSDLAAITYSADVFSMAALAAFMLTLRPPFFRQMRSGEYFRYLSQRLDERTLRAIRRGLSPDVRKRPELGLFVSEISKAIANIPDERIEILWDRGIKRFHRSNALPTIAHTISIGSNELRYPGKGFTDRPNDQFLEAGDNWENSVTSPSQTRLNEF
jgi:serine/threonine protein kinase